MVKSLWRVLVEFRNSYSVLTLGGFCKFCIFSIGVRLQYRLKPGSSTSRNTSFELRSGGALRLPWDRGSLQSLAEVWFRQEYSMVQGWDAPTCIFDLGAHIGLASCYFASLFPAARVIAVEPVKCNARFAEANVNRWGSGHVVLRAAVAPSGVESGQLRHGPASNMGSVAWGQRPSQGADLSVDAVSLSVLLDRYTTVSDRVFVKMDLEGAEAALLDDLCAIADRVCAMVMELHPPLVDYDSGGGLTAQGEVFISVLAAEGLRLTASPAVGHLFETGR